MSAVSECPSAEILAAFLENALTAEEQLALEHHLVTCRACREAIKYALPPEPAKPDE
jgi:hypothetical protein